MSCYFNIVKFGGSHTSLYPKNSQPYTEITLQQASDFVSKISADLGGTEILRPLEEIFEQKVAAGRARQVFVLTDGEVSNTEQVIEICRQNAHNSRVFTVGIGDEVSRALVEGMARAASGTAQFIVGSELTGISGGLESKLINQLKLATQPSITKVLVDWGVLGTMTPPSFHSSSTSASSSTLTTSSNSSTTTTEIGKPVPTGTPALLTIKVNCDTSQTGETVYITGDLPALGNWNPVAAVSMAFTPASFPIWAATFVANAGSKVQFKFIKKLPNNPGNLVFETIDSNHEVVVVNFAESVFDAGIFNVKSSSGVSCPTSTGASPPPQPIPVFRFFQMGPVQKAGRSM